MHMPPCRDADHMIHLHEQSQNPGCAVLQSSPPDRNAVPRNIRFHMAFCRYDHSSHHCATQASGSYALP